MVAMTTTEVTPDFGRRGRGGCCGCYGGYASGCYGGYGGGYGGCYGGGWGGCYGGGYGGCYGGGYGGCYGGGYGGGYGGSRYGSSYSPMYYGGYQGMYYGPGTMYRMPGTGDRERFSPEGGDTDGKKKGRGSNDEGDDQGQEVQKPAKAKIIVNLPADAKLTIDGQSTKSTSARRVFTSPPLEPGQSYYYNFEATLVREDRPVVTRQRVRVRAGETTRVKIDFPEASLTRR
jgi:uncharacterized protein (TIGR03000 family)